MVIHIAPIGIETAHVFEGIKDKQFGQPDKLYLLHSPNQKKQPGEKRVVASNQFKKIALDIKNQLEGFVETYLIEINAFDMNSVWDGINKIIKDEFEKDESLTLKDFAINVTGGTNLMAVASTIAAGSRGVRAYYVLNKNFKENKKPYVRELTIPNFRTERKITRNLHQLLRVISEQKFKWAGVNQNQRRIEEKYYDCHSPDSIILATAKIHGSILVTLDTKLLRSAQLEGVDAYHLSDFMKFWRIQVEY